MSSGTLSSKGQLTLPKEIREHLCMAPGDRLDFVIDEGGVVTVRRAVSGLAGLQGRLHQPGRRGLTVEEMDEGIAREHSRRG